MGLTGARDWFDPSFLARLYVRRNSQPGEAAYRKQAPAITTEGLANWATHREAYLGNNGSKLSHIGVGARVSSLCVHLKPLCDVNRSTKDVVCCHEKRTLERSASDTVQSWMRSRA